MYRQDSKKSKVSLDWLITVKFWCIINIFITLGIVTRINERCKVLSVVKHDSVVRILNVCQYQPV